MSERERLNRRIKAIAGTPLSPQLGAYRRALNKNEAIDARGVGKVLVSFGKVKFFEAADLLSQLHAWLDERDVPKLT